MSEILGLTHSCCPGKRNINPPAFVLTETLRLHGGRVLYAYDCTGCRAVVHVLVQESPSEQSPHGEPK